MKPITAMLVALPIAALAMFAEVVRLGWDANTETNLAGYRIYAGTNSREYFIVSNVVGKLTTTGEVDTPFPAVWHFAVTATNTTGLESAFSEEVVYRSVLQTPVVAGERYVLLTPSAERSTNLSDWAPMEMEPTYVPATNAQEFYRVTGVKLESIKVIQ